MKLFDVYPLWDIEPTRAQGCKIWDKDGVEYLDLYGGHAVISVGHSHPDYVARVSEQLSRLGFYSNSVQNPLQNELAERLGKLSGYDTYNLFLCNSGAEANENALKVASFATGRKRMLALQKGFHGRTSGAVEATDIKSIQAPFNTNGNVTFVPINDIEAARTELAKGEYAAFIIEPIQGVAGIFSVTQEYVKEVAELCKESGTMLIFDEVQSGYGRSGKFFAHQHCGVCGDMVTMAKGMGNGFPIGGVILSPEIEARHGMLGTTFGGNHLGCAAAIAVLDIIDKENLTQNAAQMGEYIFSRLSGARGIKELRGTGLMIGIEMEEGFESVRNALLFEKKIFTGAAGANTIRLLPPLGVTKAEIDHFIDSFTTLTQQI